MNKFLFLGVTLFLAIGIVFALPSQANDNSDRGPLEKIDFIHYKKNSGNGKPSESGNAKPSGTTCYNFLGNGAKWKVTEPYIINPTNSQGLSESLIVNTTNASVSAWENQVSFNVFGTQFVNTGYGYNNGTLDGQNTLSFGNVAETDVIGVTTIWGYFSGAPKTRQIVEWDMLLDENEYAWGDATIDPSKMDLQNIITHELGHSAGLGDLYQTDCIQQTMYGYSSEGETSKRTLGTGDVAGIKKLYG